MVRTERLELRPWTLDDLEAFHRIWGDGEVVWWGPTGNLDESRDLLGRLVERSGSLPVGPGWFAVVERGSGEIVGNVMLQPAPFVDGIELGYHFARAFQGRGYATEAARAALDSAFRVAKLERIFAAVLPENLPSQRVAAKLGMRRVGEVLHAGLEHDLLEIGRP